MTVKYPYQNGYRYFKGVEFRSVYRGTLEQCQNIRKMYRESQLTYVGHAMKIVKFDRYGGRSAYRLYVSTKPTCV